ncbi:NAD(P)-dependent oxidoreductase [Sphingobium chlorophenolicum]|uniref:2-hydroxy-3-oxopropionate reductase n=1 Tax=Sphingobium chlorophenolicum TaxID=46429 RepID=A0A081RI76_SPHCR|nr:NAD(P)-dependent oxidoreductase [Sphingobium chlorophenolicum]KEQ54899.1 2-hydroxy-3-oxopropionate reductase [Sphingobium chlorophenolicum]
MIDRVALLGTGLMGEPMARNLVRAGYALSVWNRTQAKAAALADEGAAVAETARMCVADADVVIFMLSDGPTCDRLLFDEDSGGVAGAIKPGATVVMMSSIAPDSARRQAERLAALGVDYIDAPVSGGERGAIKASLTIFAGGAPEIVERMSPLLGALGRVNLVGGVGSGQLVKLANQMIVGITIEAVAEALLLIERGGGRPAAAFAALEGGFADSTVLRQHGARMVSGDHVPGGTVATQLKDLRMATAMAADLGLSLPLLSEAEAMFRQAASGPDAALDHSAVHRTLRGLQPAEIQS